MKRFPRSPVSLAAVKLYSRSAAPPHLGIAQAPPAGTRERAWHHLARERRDDFRPAADDVRHNWLRHCALHLSLRFPTPPAKPLDGPASAATVAPVGVKLRAAMSTRTCKVFRPASASIPRRSPPRLPGSLRPALGDLHEPAQQPGLRRQSPGAILVPVSVSAVALGFYDAKPLLRWSSRNNDLS